MAETERQPRDRFSATPIDPAKYRDEYEVERTRLLEEMIPAGPGRAIDVGCGPGHFTAKLAQKGWQTTAIDTDPSNLDRARRHAAETHLGDAISVLGGLAAGSYDLACAFEIIEHMPEDDGGALLAALRDRLRQGGMLLLSTPNRLSPEGASGYYWGQKLRGWGQWTAWDPTHVHIYSSFEIVRVCRRQGFQVEAVTGYWYRAVLPGLGREVAPPWRSSSRFPLSYFGFNTMIRASRR